MKRWKILNTQINIILLGTNYYQIKIMQKLIIYWKKTSNNFICYIIKFFNINQIESKQFQSEINTSVILTVNKHEGINISL